MTIVEFLLLVVIAGVAGSLGQLIAGYSLGGCLVSIVVGFIGAYVGMWLARELDLPELLVITIDETPFPLLWSVIGSALVALILGLVTRRPVVID